MILKPVVVGKVSMSQQRIGTGAYSDVYDGEYDGKHVAVKKFRYCGNDAMKDMMAEGEIMMELHHPNIVACYGCGISVDGYPVLILERAEKSLALFFREENLKNVTLTNQELKRRALQICDAVKYLHDKHISHGDLSIKNIVVDSNGNFKLCDFGFAMQIHGTSELDPKHLCTPASAAPELLSSWMRSLSTDVFSVGIILLELVLRNSAYSITNLNKYETPYGYDQYLFIQDIIHGFRPRLPRDCPQCTSEYVKVMYPKTKKTFHRPTIDDVISMLNAWES
ncbi:serine/threonine protein kinase [Blastocystis sp. subtype 4]|uniref:serine/threonine protein kinase n=1 Tax=Blastocystis sp. subtype 4 TaxID=944170 RepID=UPI0007115D37|nr:serine/threonine protein kinase [Blastocystis sp. subtype 4]KNB46430.1 serine/threonine protein kinase [Blastocystis sp. subtype 4]|eukprot:XP_014529873.1 serine/threonine protein kinase [Blastocystis sp. subtype 4]